ncbi:amidohydrolase family protein [Paludibaculum fermentans]|uniref:Amidohydrolase family protein n=1 Tax=Paludibaculum fermentans TaxID=1473598 RepID=A0A7S7NUJ8_PALFE|nr:amidohydrolase family protein [Paludibaculum fermentans]
MRGGALKRILVLLAALAPMASAQIAIQGETVYTMAGAPLKNAVVLVRDGKIERVTAGTAPAGYQVIKAKVVTPGLIDAHAVLGLSGYLNQPQDQDQIENSAPMQPELRAIDAFDPKERLIEWVRGLGVTTIHTGHGQGILISGQTMIIKTNAETADQAMVPAAMIAATLGNDARAGQGKSPGTRSKMIAMLRAELIKAQEAAKKASDKDKKDTARDLRLEAFVKLINREMPLLITVHKDNDILTALRLAKEFNLKVVLDGVADAPEVLAQIKASGYPVILHPTMQRSSGDAENLSMETASKLAAAGVPFALQSGFEGYVPKTRVVLWEAALAAANGLAFDKALGSITIDAARLLGVEKRVGSLEAGKDADVALYDGDPFEYTTHCVGVLIDGKVVSDTVR